MACYKFPVEENWLRLPKYSINLKVQQHHLHQYD